MGRWEPNGRERLVLAALDLFAEQGYDSTTVAQIAERAGLTKTTFFRHFPDKREVLFVGQPVHSRLLVDAITDAPADATPMEAVAAALDAVTASFVPEQRAFGPRLLKVVAANRELRERSAFKRYGLAEAVAQALRLRGVEERTATVAAELGMLAFHDAFARWTEPPHERTFTELAREELERLWSAAAGLGEPRVTAAEPG
jgi:AcrR family transcriptional regulator